MMVKNKNIIRLRRKAVNQYVTHLKTLVPKCNECGLFLVNDVERQDGQCGPCRMSASERECEAYWCYTFEGRW